MSCKSTVASPGEAAEVHPLWEQMWLAHRGQHVRPELPTGGRGLASGSISSPSPAAPLVSLGPAAHDACRSVGTWPVLTHRVCLCFGSTRPPRTGRAPTLVFFPVPDPWSCLQPSQLPHPNSFELFGGAVSDSCGFHAFQEFLPSRECLLTHTQTPPPMCVAQR